MKKIHLKNNTLQNSLVADIGRLVKVQVEQGYCCPVWVPAEIVFDDYEKELI